MSSKSSLPFVLFVFLNLLFLGLVASSSAYDSPPKQSSKHKHKHHSHKYSNTPISPPMSFSNPRMQYPPKLPPSFPLPSSPPSVFPGTPKLPPAFPLPPLSPPFAFQNARKSSICPRDAISFWACGKVLGGLLGSEVGTTPRKKPCCRLFGGLVEVEAAVCLCTAIKANVLGFNLNVPVSLGLVLNICDIKTPPNFQCS